VIERDDHDLDFNIEIAWLADLPGETASRSLPQAYLTSGSSESEPPDFPRAAGRPGCGERRRDSVEALVEAARPSFAALESSRSTWAQARAAEDLSPVAELNGRPVLVAGRGRVGKPDSSTTSWITPNREA